MIVKELMSQVRDIIQDTDKIYFSDSELLNIYNECKRYINAERKENPTTIEIETSEGVYEYDVDNVLRYISCKDKNLYPDNGDGDDDSSGIIVKSYNLIYVNEPKDETLLMKVISFPSEDNVDTVIRMGDENLYKYYMLSKAYEKDSDLEQFQKSQYFIGMFNSMVKTVKKDFNNNYINKTQTTKSYYF